MSRDIKVDVLAKSNVLSGKRHADDFSDKRQADEGDIEKDEAWKPTQEVYEAFVERDFNLANLNLEMAMLNAGRPMTMRDLKESLLHSIDTIERVLTSKMATGRVVEDKGRYSLSNIR